MENLNYSLACGIMSASGFTLAYYQHLAFNQRKKASEKCLAEVKPPSSAKSLIEC